VPLTRILHRAGNVRDLLPFADHPGVDAIEADVWVRGHHIVAHHERPVGPLPLLVGGWRLRRLPPQPVSLAELVDAVHGRARLVLDVRSWFGDPAPRLSAELMEIEPRDHFSVTCESWAIADRLRSWLRDLEVGYSVRSPRQLARYVAAAERGKRPPTPVAVRHSLLRSPEDVAALHRVSPTVTAWTVDDVDRALELAEWGVDGIVSNLVTVLNAV